MATKSAIPTTFNGHHSTCACDPCMAAEEAALAARTILPTYYWGKGQQPATGI